MKTVFMAKNMSGGTCGHTHKTPWAAKRCMEKLLQPTAAMRKNRVWNARWHRAYIIAIEGGEPRPLNADEEEAIALEETEADIRRSRGY